MDVVARPGLLAIDGTVASFEFNFATREFPMHFRLGTGAVESLIYVPVDRYYPDGFCIDYNEGLTMTLDPASDTGVRVIKAQSASEVMKVRWEAQTQRLRIAAWPRTGQTAICRIYPGRSGTHPRAAANK